MIQIDTVIQFAQFIDSFEENLSQVESLAPPSAWAALAAELAASVRDLPAAPDETQLTATFHRMEAAVRRVPALQVILNRTVVAEPVATTELRQLKLGSPVPKDNRQRWQIQRLQDKAVEFSKMVQIVANKVQHVTGA
ncbi:MAG: hypothetical protein JXA89_26550 [Anaerolineae bacterium]|nr:hypothetical protein [Anaerolineae bacterium]